MPATTAPGRRRLRVGCEFLFGVAADLPTVLQVEVRRDGGFTIVEEHLEVEPATGSSTYLDLYGNRCRRLRLDGEASTVRYEAVVDTTADVDDEGTGNPDPTVAGVPDEVLHFTLPSRYCESDLLATTAWRLFGGVDPGWPRARAVCDWVHANIDFAPASTGPMTTASDVYLQRRGVCRDFTHLGVTFLRALNIPARYCFGYLPDIDVPAVDESMDFVAWLEAWIGGRWYTLDPRNNMRRTGRVLVGRGRDAADVSMVTSFGPLPLLGLRVVAEEAEVEPWSSAAPAILDLVGRW